MRHFTIANEHNQPCEESIGQRLRRLRLERGLSQRDLSERGVSYAYVSRIEGGSRRPSVKAIRKLAGKLGVSAEYLETGSDVRAVDDRELRLADAELELRLADDPTRAEEALKDVLDESLEAGDPIAAARARAGLGLVAAQTGRNAEAVDRLEQAIETTRLSPSVRPDVYATLGGCYAALGRPEQAVKLFETCLDKLAKEAPDDRTAHVRFATYLSYALTDMGDLRRAQSVLDDALAGTDDLADPYTRIRLYWSLARLSGLGGDYSAALTYIRRAIALLEVSDDTRHLARAHLLCGTIMISSDEAEEAGLHFESAERLFGPRPDPVDLANLRTDQAKHAVRLGRAEEAGERAREALAVLGDQSPEQEGNAWWALAEALALQADIDGAGDAFRRAVDLLEEHGQRRDCVDAYRAWAKLLRGAGRESEALDVLERAADLATERAPRTQLAR